MTRRHVREAGACAEPHKLTELHAGIPGSQGQNCFSSLEIDCLCYTNWMIGKSQSRFDRIAVRLNRIRRADRLRLANIAQYARPIILSPRHTLLSQLLSEDELDWTGSR